MADNGVVRINWSGGSTTTEPSPPPAQGDVKTIRGLDPASVKTINGTVITLVKSINGVSNGTT